MSDEFNESNKNAENFQTWIREVMSKINENLGSNVDEAEYEIVKSKWCGYQSTSHYVRVRFQNKINGQTSELFLFLKRPVQIQLVRERHQVDYQFHNEILFYRMYAQSDENFAKCFYVDERPHNLVIALEDVSKHGFNPSPRDAPMEYTLAAMREIGRFHAKGYVMKELQRERFFDIVKQLQGVRYNEEGKEDCSVYLNTNATRAVDYLRSCGHDSVFCDKMQVLLSNAYDEVVNILKPLEPLSTLCHGDFTMTNVLFKTEDDGQCRAMLIDFAFLRYATPVVDLSMYLCSCDPNVLKEDKFYNIMRVYHDALKEYLLDAGVWDIDKYSYDALLDNYRKGGIIGFMIASFFLPMSLGHFGEETYIQKLMSIPREECAKLCKQAGGDEVSKILADILLNLRDLGCLRDVL